MMSNQIYKGIKKNIIMVLVIGLVVSMFAGCNQNEPDTTKNEAKTNSEATKSESNQEKKELVYFTNERPERYQTLIDRFKKENPNIDFEIVGFSGADDKSATDAFAQKLDMMIAAGDQIDVVSMSGGTGLLRPRAMNGIILPLDEYIKKDGMNMDEEFVAGSDRTCAFVAKGSNEKKFFTLPLSKTYYPVYYNKDMFKEAALAEPEDDWTFDQLVEYANKLTKGEGIEKVFGSWIPVDWGWFVGVPAQVAGWNAYEVKDGKKAPNFGDKYLKKTIEFFYQLSVTDKANPSFIEISLNKLNMVDQFVSGKTAMVVGNAWAFDGIKKARAMGRADFELGIAPLPRLDKDVPTDVTASEISGFYVIPTTAKYPYEAFKYMKFVSHKGMDLVGAIPASKKVDKEIVVKSLATYIDEEGNKHENLFTMEELKGLFDNRQGMKSYYEFPEDEYIGPLWGVLGSEMGNILSEQKTIEEGIDKMMERGQKEIDKIEANK